METETILVILFSVLFLQFRLLSSTVETDRIALLAFKSNLKYIPQGKISSWNDSLHFCQWEGITCGRKHKRVTILDLTSSGLVGSLSPYIGNLSFTRQIFLDHNTLRGTIPPEVGRLSRLEHLSLTNNSIEGEIPTSLFDCSNLVNLSIGYNKLVGRIPDEVGSLSKLQNLIFYSNNLTGRIPNSIGNLTSLESLSGADNNLWGSIPDIFYRLKNLNFLAVGENELVGTIPPSVYNLSLLNLVSLAANNLHGTLPQNLGLLFPRLNYFQIYANNFTGPVPYSLGNASNLEHLEMQYNKFSGKLPIDFSRLTQFRVMNVFSNNLGTGRAGDLNFMASLLNCSNLIMVQLLHNNFGGELPKHIGNNISTSLERLNIESNMVSGSIPSWIGTLTNLTAFSMTINKLTGPIPDVLGNLKKLRILGLAGNMLSGNIPISLGSMSSIIRLRLEVNKLHGAIPSSLGNCQNLIDLNLSTNSLSGEIPKQLFNIQDLSISLDLSHNHLVGRLPEEVGNLNQLGILDVSDNELSGVIPNSIGRCRSLEVLAMQGNLFQGLIPPSLWFSKGIQMLDLSRNNLTGNIPKYFELFSLQYLNLSFNDFEGEVPTEGIFSRNASFLSVLGNKRLCGGISELKLPKCPFKGAKKKHMTSLLVIMLTTIASFLLIVAIIVILIYFRFKRKRNEITSGTVETLSKVSYTMLLKATDGFSTANLIGAGGFSSVYKGIIEPDEQIVAIKVLNLQSRGASKSFMAECEALRSIRHRNLLKLITSCSSVDYKGNDFKALVYEFMPNGGLDTWLHNTPESNTNVDKPRNLNLFRLINIAFDVASALEYLHHHCERPIIHCDLKPSNILLDLDMTAHVGDFGLAKILQEFTNPNESSSIGIRGTIGYAAPEYGVGSMVSASGDVYSFGIVLLEMMTGKKPISAVFEEGLNLHTFAKYALPDRVKQIVDPILLSEESEEMSINNIREECLTLMVKLGVACSMESPRDRMEIRSVVRELHLAKKSLDPTLLKQKGHNFSLIT